MIGGDVVADFAEDFGDDLGLDAEEDDAGLADGFAVVRAGMDLELIFEGAGAVGVGGSGPDLVWFQQLISEEGLEEDGAHFSGSEDGEFFWADAGHRRVSFRGVTSLGI